MDSQLDAPRYDLGIIQRYKEGRLSISQVEQLLSSRVKYPDMKFPRLKIARSNGFHYNRDTLRYGRFRCRRQSINSIGILSDNNARHKKPDWWWEAQFKLYGISFKDGDDMRGVAMWALKQGLFNSPSDEMKALETRLVEEFRVNKHNFVEQLIAYCKEKARRAALMKKRETEVDTDGVKNENTEEHDANSTESNRLYLRPRLRYRRLY